MDACGVEPKKAAWNSYVRISLTSASVEELCEKECDGMETSIVIAIAVVTVVPVVVTLVVVRRKRCR